MACALCFRRAPPGAVMRGEGQARVPRRDRLKQLRAFCEAVRLGSLTRAAEAVESSQSAVSQQVSALEREVGAVLFRRRGAGIVPTRVGVQLHRLALPLVHGVLRLPERFDEDHHGAAPERLVIGAGEVSAAYLLPGPLGRFRERHPATRITLRTGGGAERLAWLRAFEADVVVAAFDIVPDGIEFRPFHACEIVLAAPEDHPLAGARRVALEDAVRHPMVAPVAGTFARRFQDMALGRRGLAPRVVLEVDGWGAILNHVAAGAGIAFVPDVCIAPSERVCTLRLAEPALRRTYGLATRRDRLGGVAVERFVQLTVAEGADAR